MPRSILARICALMAAAYLWTFNVYAACPAATCTANDQVSLNDCIDAAGPGAVIDLGNAVIDLTTSVNLDGPTALHDITTSITIQNGTLSKDPTLAFRILHVASTGNLSLCNVTLQNGNDQSAQGGAGGGAIFVASGGTIGSITDSMFIGNQSDTAGGAIYLVNLGTITLLSTSGFFDNIAINSNGGAISMVNGTISTLQSTTFSNNIANGGGA